MTSATTPCCARSAVAASMRRDSKSGIGVGVVPLLAACPAVPLPSTPPQRAVSSPVLSRSLPPLRRQQQPLSRRPAPSSSSSRVVSTSASLFFGGGSGKDEGNDKDGVGINDETAATANDDGGARALLAYSQAVTADDVDFFTRAAPEHVVGAMSETVSGLLGSLACAASDSTSVAEVSSSLPASASAALSSSSSSRRQPPTAFDVRVRARDADLGQLLYSTLMTGYLMRNAASRLRLKSRFSSGSTAGTEGRGGRATTAMLPPTPTTPKTTETEAKQLPSPSSSSSSSFSEEGAGEGESKVNPTTLPPEARAAALASLEGTPRLAPGTQTSRVEGDVLKWDHSHGAVSVPAAAYIKALEEELAAARKAAADAAAAAAAASTLTSMAVVPSTQPPPPPPATSSPSSNPLLAYLRSADESSLASLTSEASAGVLEAANAFVQRMMTGGEEARSGGVATTFGAGGFGVAVGGSSRNSNAASVIREYRASELRHLLLFVMVVGFMLRTLEARLDLEFSMLLPPSDLGVVDGGDGGDGGDDGRGEQLEEDSWSE